MSSKKLSVYIVGGGIQMINMYEANGWYVSSRIEDADLIQFTGGADVSPHLYEEDVHPMTTASPGRDNSEARDFAEALDRGIPMTGICRGGQFLNVMNGGKMYQHVDMHTIGGHHDLIDVDSGEVIKVTSTHHQMMRAGEGGTVVATGGHRSTFRQHMVGSSVASGSLEEEDTEVVHYPKTKTLCFQPHPEFVNKNHECQMYYFDLLEDLLGLPVIKESRTEEVS